MIQFADTIQHADWKNEKHVPIIECPTEVRAGEMFEVRASIGKEIAHPNTTEHHIVWIELYFIPEGEKFVYEIGRFEFKAHGASTKGPNESTIYTHHAVAAQMKTGKPGTLFAVAYCNIHGLWESSLQIQVTG